jgi:hypothetical protein
LKPGAFKQPPAAAVAAGLWFMVYGLWFMVYGLWFMVYGLWFMVYGAASVAGAAGAAAAAAAMGQLRSTAVHPPRRGLLAHRLQRLGELLPHARDGEEHRGVAFQVEFESKL